MYVLSHLSVGLPFLLPTRIQHMLSQLPLGLIAATTSLPLFITVGCFDLPQQFFLFHLSLVLTFSTLSILLCTTP